MVGQRKAMDYLRDYAKASVPKETLGERVIDGTLRSEQRAEAVAYAAMLQDTLRNALVRESARCLPAPPPAATLS